MLKIHGSTRANIAYLRASGRVDESFNPEMILAHAGAKTVVLNLKEVTHLSSFGVREWTRMMRDLCAKAEHVYLVECSPAIVVQLILVANFGGTSEVLSIRAPFACEACGADDEVLVDVTIDPVPVPTPECESCGRGPMQFVDDPAVYFSVPGRPKQLTENIQSVITHLGQITPERTQEPTPSAPIPMPKISTTSSVSVETPAPIKKKSMVPPMLKAAGITVAVGSVLLAGAFVVLGRGPSIDREFVARSAAEGRFDRAAAAVAKMRAANDVDDAVADQLYSQVTRAALARFAKSIESDRFDEAESISRQLLAPGVLAPGKIQDFDRGLASIREEAWSAARKLAHERFGRGEFVTAFDLGRRAESIAPLDADTLFVMAESARQSKRAEAAADYYQAFLESLGPDAANDARFVSALYWRAMGLSETGRFSEAEPLLKKVAEIDSGDLKASALRVLGSGGEPSRAPPRATRSP